MILDPTFVHLLAAMTPQSAGTGFADANEDWITHSTSPNFTGYSMEERGSHGLNSDTFGMDIDFGYDAIRDQCSDSFLPPSTCSPNGWDGSIECNQHAQLPSSPLPQSDGAWALSVHHSQAGAFQYSDQHDPSVLQAQHSSFQCHTPRPPIPNLPGSVIHPTAFLPSPTTTSFLGMRPINHAREVVHRVPQLFAPAWQGAHVNTACRAPSPPFCDTLDNTLFQDHHTCRSDPMLPGQLPFPQIPAHEACLQFPYEFQHFDTSFSSPSDTAVGTENGALYWNDDTIAELLFPDRYTSETACPHPGSNSFAPPECSVHHHERTESPYNQRFTQVPEAVGPTSSWGNPVELQQTRSGYAGQRLPLQYGQTYPPAPTSSTRVQEAVVPQPSEAIAYPQSSNALAMPTAIQHSQGPSRENQDISSEHTSAPSFSMFTSKKAYRKMVEDVQDLGDGFLQSTFVLATAEGTGRGPRFVYYTGPPSK
ncbi:hypothetical protein CVT26_001064 [Gymnopilus dilepis]|uniref:Uncharacterized protein n=1 Tax=Gymnopilus dilepis TaxID=231916 RepID=A0A409WBJ6_9AGAR|nr:hypothetical protein CVT26_001064 [Gymnopilus dilepis]